MNREKFFLRNSLKQKIVFAFLMGFVTTGMVSFTLVCVNVGFTKSFFKIWFKSWTVAYLVVVPMTLFVAPKIERFVSFWFKERDAFNERQKSFSGLENDRI